MVGSHFSSQVFVQICIEIVIRMDETVIAFIGF